MTGPESTGMNYGDDYVSARLAIDIPEGSAQGLREITQEVERFRVAMEAATHAEADITNYLNQMAEASIRASEAQSNLTQELNTYMSLAGRMSGVPQGTFQQPFGASGLGTGGLGPMFPSSVGQRPPSPTDISTQVGQWPNSNPQEYLNMQHARGAMTAQDMINISPESIQSLAVKIAERERALGTQAKKTDKNAQSPTDPDIGEPGTEGGMGQRAQRMAGLAGQILNEMGPYGSAVGIGGLASRGLRWGADHLGKHHSAAAPGGGPNGEDDDDDEDTEELPTGRHRKTDAVPRHAKKEEPEEKPEDKGTFGLGSVLGKLSGGLMALTAGIALFEKGGQMVQGWRNVGSLRGGAAGEGAQVEAKARIMAMNPFITGDQARQIYQSVMSEGYAGANGSGADNVIDFMKHNLTSMNIDVAESTKMLRSTISGNVSGDPDSVAGAVKMLGTELDEIRTLSRKGRLSQPEFRQKVESLQDTLVNQGASPEGAANAAMTLTEAGSDDQNLKGQLASVGGDLSSTTRGQMMLRMYGGFDIDPGLFPGEEAGDLADKHELAQATENTFKHWAVYMHNAYENGSTSGRRNAVRQFWQWCRTYAPSSDAAKSRKAAEALYLRLIGGGESMVQKATEDVKSQPPLPSSGALPEPPSGGGGGGITGPNASGRFTPEQLGQVEAQASPSTAEWAGNTASPSADPSQPAARSGGQAPSVDSNSQGGQIISFGGGGNQAASVTIDLTPEAAKALKVVGPNPARLSSTQQGANRGIAGHQVNDEHIGPY